MKVLKISWMLVVILTCNLFFVSCFSEDNPVSEKEQWHYVTMERRRLLITRPVRAPSVNAVPTTPSPSN